MCVCVRVCVCVYVYIYVCVSICIYMYVCVYIYIYINSGVHRPPEGQGWNGNIYIENYGCINNTTVMVIIFFMMLWWLNASEQLVFYPWKILPSTPLHQPTFSTFPIIKLGGVTVYDIGVTGFSSSVVSDLVKVSLVRVLAALFWDQWIRPPLKWLQCHSKGRVVFDLVSGGCRCTGPCDCPAGKETDITYLPSIKTSSGTFDWQPGRHSSWRPSFLPSVVFSALIRGKSEHIFCLV